MAIGRGLELFGPSSSPTDAGKGETMTDKQAGLLGGAKQASIDDLERGALEHYDQISNKACHWMNTIPRAIKFYFDAQRKAAQAEINASEQGARTGGCAPPPKEPVSNGPVSAAPINAEERRRLKRAHLQPSAPAPAAPGGTPEHEADWQGICAEWKERAVAAESALAAAREELETLRPRPFRDCPYASPFRYCPECVVSPCPIGLDKNARRS